MTFAITERQSLAQGTNDHDAELSTAVLDLVAAGDKAVHAPAKPAPVQVFLTINLENTMISG